MATAPPPPAAGKGRPRQPRPAPLWAADTLLECLPDAAWATVPWRDGTTTPLTTQFVAVRVHRATGSPATGRSTTHHRPTTGPQGWRLGERPVSGETGERKWSFCWLPDLPLDAPLGRLVTLAHARWPIEQCSEDATGVPKTPPARVATGACGLDDCQGRRWEGLHRHLALVLLTYSFLVTERLRARAFPATPPPAPAGLPPLGDHAPRAAAPAHLPGPASAGAALALRGPAALERRHRSVAPFAHPPLSPPAPLLTK